MKLITCLIALQMVAAFRAGAAPDTVQYTELSPSRIAEIEAFLPEHPGGFGRPISDRTFWSGPGIAGLGTGAVREADRLVTQEFPDWDDDAYLEYSRVGRRPSGEQMESRRSAWLQPLVLAECVEDKGRFVSTLNRVLDAYAAEPTWTLPAHDGSLENFHRTAYAVDLRAAAFGNNLAIALFLLGDRIEPGVRERLGAALEQRLFAPIRRSLASGQGNGWLGSRARPNQNNWNPVCLAGVVGAALAVIPDRHDRAVFVAAGEHYSRYYLNSFHEDGYCGEGVGYWNYGFGQFIVLREELMQSTAGRIDLFADPRIVDVALFGVRIQLGGRAVPPFADCRFGSRVSESIVVYCNRVFKLGLTGLNQTNFSRRDLATILMTSTPCNAPASAAVDPIGVRTFFNKAGVLACRPAPGSTCQLGAAIKAGGNSSHSHNDIGSFTIALEGEEPVGDPGGPFAYDNKTFGPDRYTHKILNSFGHPVPVIAGKLQREAAKASPRVLTTNFTDGQDEIRIDIASAYEVPGLEKLVRTLRFSRAGSGEVIIEDEVGFSAPQAFATALVTHGTWKQVAPDTIAFTTGDVKLLARIETPDGFTLEPEVIQELGARPFTRLGIALSKPVTAATVRMSFRPAPSP